MRYFKVSVIEVYVVHAFSILFHSAQRCWNTYQILFFIQVHLILCQLNQFTDLFVMLTCQSNFCWAFSGPGSAIFKYKYCNKYWFILGCVFSCLVSLLKKCLPLIVTKGQELVAIFSKIATWQLLLLSSATVSPKGPLLLWFSRWRILLCTVHERELLWYPAVLSHMLFCGVL